jgi:hypothetical protein
LPDTLDLELEVVNQRFLLLNYIVTQGRQYAWQSLKNCVKRLIGRKPCRDERLVFYRRYILHRLGLRRIDAITCVIDEVTEGACTRAFFVMRTIRLARASGLAYLHSPFTRIGHADRPMQEWVAAWEAVFNLGADELSFDGRTSGVINNSYQLARDLELCFGCRDRRNRKHELQEQFQALMPEFRRRYYLNKSPRTTQEVTVAVHIRRGDISTNNPLDKYTATEKVLRIASAVKTILDSHVVPMSIRIYSEGDEKDFAELSPLGAEFFLNADTIWTIQELAEADILIVAKSFFSLYAGYMSDGIKIIEEPWSWTFVSAPDDWIRCNEDGLFDPAAFERQLSLLLEAKSNVGAARADSR